MRCILSTALLIAACASPLSAQDTDWTFVPDRLNNPVYDGPSGLAGEVAGSTVHIWGTNTDTPPGATVPDDAELLWPGLAAEHSSMFSQFEVTTTASMSGSGYGYAIGITLWQDASRYVIYGLNWDDTSGVQYIPSRWTALGAWPNPDFAPSWAPLGSAIADPAGPHTYSVTYGGGTVQFSLDGSLLDTLDYPMTGVNVRLVAYARTHGDAVDATFSTVVVSGAAVPEPSTILAVCGGFLSLACLRTRRRY